MAGFASYEVLSIVQFPNCYADTYGLTTYTITLRVATPVSVQTKGYQTSQNTGSVQGLPKNNTKIQNKK